MLVNLISLVIWFSGARLNAVHLVPPYILTLFINEYAKFYEELDHSVLEY